jgi:hypothetical protein
MTGLPTPAPPAARPFGQRWPRSFFGLAPLLAWLASLLILVVLVPPLVGWLAGMARASPEGPGPLLRAGATGLRWFALYGLPLCWSAAFCRYALRRHLPRTAPLLGVTVMALLAALANLQLQLPGPGQGGVLSAGLGLALRPGAIALVIARTLFVLLPFAVAWRRWRVAGEPVPQASS